MLVCFVSLMHICWGLLLMLHHGAILTTSTHVFRDMGGQDHFGLRAFVYIVSGLLPIILLIRPGSLIGLVSTLPQQGLLIMSGIGALTAIVARHFADGVARDWEFIAMDQGIYIVLAVLYAFETLDRFHDHRHTLNIYYTESPTHDRSDQA